MSIASKQIIIAAISCRAYVEAAVAAGFEVVAIDAFVDVDLQRVAKQCFQVDVQDNTLDQDQLLQLLDRLDLTDFSGFCYGAGFEQNPTLLASIAARIPVLGNTAACVEKCKTVEYFFPLCDQLCIPHPAVTIDVPKDTSGWLQKRRAQSGGAHVKWSENASSDSTNDVYYQQFQSGKTVSCLFLATEHGVQLIGLSEQWTDDDSAEPFRYGGAVSQAEITDIARERFMHYIGEISQALGLIGLNSCDAICDGDDVYVLEINPRLSATIVLYVPHYHNIMAWHLAACQDNRPADISALRSNAKRYAHQVIYARQEIHLNDEIEWPAWVNDRPQVGEWFVAGSPVCTVRAEGSTTKQAMELVKKRAISLERQLYN